MNGNADLSDYVLLVLNSPKELEEVKKEVESLDSHVNVGYFNDPVEALKEAEKNLPKVLISSENFQSKEIPRGVQLAGELKYRNLGILTILYSPELSQSRLFDGHIEQSDPAGSNGSRHKELVETLSSKEIFGIRCHEGHTYTFEPVPNVTLYRTGR